MRHADVIVIGGGIAGISAAAELATEAHVLVLEGEAQIGYHSTGRSAAIFIRNYGNATLRALNAAAAPIFEAPAGISDRSLLSPRGELMVASEAEMATLEAYCDGATGIDRLTGAEAAEHARLLARTEGIFGGYSAGANLAAAIRLLQGAERGGCVAFVVCDSGLKYLSTDLWGQGNAE